MEYTITLKHDIAVITLTGNLVHDSKELLEKLHQEILLIEATLCIIYFKEITIIEYSIYKELTMLQHDIRRKKMKLCLFGLDTKIKMHLIEKGIIRSSEVKKDLAEALALKIKS